jgi:DNA-binding XRE family transcriptional regulator
MQKENILKELNLSIIDKDKDTMYVNKLRNTKDKVKYLRRVKNYTQLEAAEIIGISERHVQRIEKEI